MIRAEEWLAQMPHSPELSRWHVKKTVNDGQVSTRPLWGELARDEAITFNIDVG